MRAQAHPRRRIWPYLLGATLLVAAIIIGVSISNGSWGSANRPAAPTSSSAPSPSASGSSAATGCLGGSARDAAMIARASASASQTEAGAVDFAASFVRWLQRYPYPTAAEAGEVQSTVLAADSFTADLASYLAAQPDLSGGIVPIGTTYYMSTVPGVWHTESSSPDQVVVSVGTAFVVGGSLSSTLRSSITLTLNWVDGRWRIAAADGTRTTQDLFSIGTPFEGGC